MDKKETEDSKKTKNTITAVVAVGISLIVVILFYYLLVLKPQQYEEELELQKQLLQKETELEEKQKKEIEKKLEECVQETKDKAVGASDIYEKIGNEFGEPCDAYDHDKDNIQYEGFSHCSDAYVEGINEIIQTQKDEEKECYERFNPF